MYQNSKIEVRCEAIKLASSLKDVTSENVVLVSKNIEAYIVGDIKLPDVYDPNAFMKELAVKMQEMMEAQTEDNKKASVIEHNQVKITADA